MWREQIAILQPLFYFRAAVIVQTRELAEQLYRHIIVRNRGVFLIIKIADVNLVVFVTDFRHPFAGIFMPANALVSAGAVFIRQAVIAVL